MKALIETDPGKTLLAYTAMLSWAEMAQLWAKAMGQTVDFRELSLENLKQQFPIEGEELLSAKYSTEYGYNGGDPEVIDAATLGFRDRPDEIEAWIREQDWSVVLDLKSSGNTSSH